MRSLFDHVDPRLQATLRAEFERRRGEWVEALPRAVSVVLAGHRAAGKSTLLPHVARLLGREAVDLDVELERRHHRSLHDWVLDDEPGFRRAERAAFCALPANRVVAVGGGFLAKHPDLLRAQLTVLVPVSYDTYLERLRSDTSRPRLLPHLRLEDELREVWYDREPRHQAVRTVSLVELALRASRGARPARVVTLAPGEDPAAFAWQARHRGADLLEVRTDLIDPSVDLRAAARALPLLMAQRGASVPEAWRALSSLIDRPLEEGGGETLVSFHSPTPLSPTEALAAWASVPVGSFIKHVEPLGALVEAPRLFETRDALVGRFGEANVTVLTTGPLALPFRAVLARRNALDYLALDTAWAAAPGQRLLEDAVREWRHPVRDLETARLAILGQRLAHSRSPRVHPLPFDRIDLPEGVALDEVLTALRPHYRGFAVTTPFKRAAARAAGARREAVNTLARTGDGWSAHNSDVEGARATLEALGAREVTVLGDGGVGDALREAAGTDYVLRFVRRHQLVGPISGAVVWTWPLVAEHPAQLRFEQARVAVIAYGPQARSLALTIRALGGTPVRLGPRWFIAQARGQRGVWESAP